MDIIDIGAAVQKVRQQISDPSSGIGGALSATYVTFKNFDGSPVTGKHVEITLTADGTDIDNIRVVTP